MNKSNLVAIIAKRSGFSKLETTKILDELTNTITETLSKDEGVVITGFGSFMVKKIAAKTERNPRTGAKIYIKKNKVLAFAASRSLKQIISKSEGTDDPGPSKKID